MDQILNISSSLLNTSLSTAVWTIKPLLSIIASNIPTGAPGAGGGSKLNQITIYSLPPSMKKWITIAGLMGASAVAIGAYGAHVVYPRQEIADKRKAVFETANKYHFLHSLAIISVPFARKANISGVLFITGTAIFSGSCYYYAVTGREDINKYAPYGGIALILAWLSLAL